MRTCKKWKVSPTATGSTKKVCAQWESAESQDTDDAQIVESEEKLGLLLPEPIRGLGNIGFDDVIGPGVGLAGTALGTVIAARWGGRLSPKIAEYSHIVGPLIGVVASLPLYWVKGAGKKAMIQGVVTSAAIGIAMFAMPKLIQLASGEALPAAPSATAGLGLLTTSPVGYLPEVSQGTNIPTAVYGQSDPGVFGRSY